MRHVFISYCREDAEFAKTLETQVELTGLRVWRDSGLRAGEDWRAEIDRGVREALSVIVILSPESVHSAYVNYEWAFAFGSGIPVIPVLYKPVVGCVHARLQERGCIDLSTSAPARWRDLFARLEETEDATRLSNLLVRRGTPPSLQAAAQSLDSMDLKERDAALASLIQTTHPEVVEILAEAIHHPLRRVRQVAAAELARRRDVRAIPALLEALKGPRPLYLIVREDMLSQVGPAAVPVLAGVLEKEPDQDLRRVVYEALQSIGDPQALRVLRSHLGNALTVDRYFAALALAQHADGSAVPVLVESVHGGDRLRRRDSLYALKNYLETLKDQVLPLFIEALDDEDDDVVRAGVSGLEASQDPAAVPYLLESVFRARYDFMNSAARFALQKFGALPAPYLNEAITHVDHEIRLRALHLLKTMKDVADPELLRKALDDPDQPVKIAAIKAVGQVKASSAVGALLECLNDDDGSVVSAAVWSLGTIGDPRSVPPLLSLLETGYGEILRGAVIALGKIGAASASATPRLIEFLNDKDLASTADSALQEIGTREAKTASRIWRTRNRQ